MSSGGNTNSDTVDPGQRYGTIYTVDTTQPQPTPNVLYRFTDGRFTNNINADGFLPMGLVRRPDAGGKMHFYGATQMGGASGGGTLFELTTDGTHDGTTLTTIHDFDDPQRAGTAYEPDGHLLLQPNGEIYGFSYGNRGAFYRVVSDGTRAGTTFTVLYSYIDTPGPYQGLIQAPDVSGKHVSYGAALNGGTGFIGSVEKIVTGGTVATTTVTRPYQFTGVNGAGEEPTALALGADGNLYGATSVSTDPNQGSGFLFRLTPSGMLTKLYSFADTTTTNDGIGVNNDGKNVAGIVDGGDGYLYVTASYGPNGTGVIFQFDPTLMPKLPACFSRPIRGRTQIRT
jgi:uncharacterized repeat protein (TIGR03803 family)